MEPLLTPENLLFNTDKELHQRLTLVSPSNLFIHIYQRFCLLNSLSQVIQLHKSCLGHRTRCLHRVLKLQVLLSYQRTFYISFLLYIYYIINFLFFQEFAAVQPISQQARLKISDLGRRNLSQFSLELFNNIAIISMTRFKQRNSAFNSFRSSHCVSPFVKI